uniref:Uncharacterized protein n=1 Tax=Fagus sylvatica TaxID=28930 RepID=A0A2N9F336_FAGSY
MVRSRSDGSESPPPPLPLPTFRFFSHPSDLALYSGDRLEALGDSNLHRHPSPLSTQICQSSERRDPLRQLMIGGHRTWRLLPDRLLIDPTFGGLLGWDYGSKSYVVPVIDSCSCS